MKIINSKFSLKSGTDIKIFGIMIFLIITESPRTKKIKNVSKKRLMAVLKEYLNLNLFIVSVFC